ncbi:Flp pilus assembly protein CpaB [Rhodoferax sp.]|uniref:Flp pilus assembly protein CpaB n=1 Tax=Rhodoferax sp. TaxID=50421 RepID=UPI002764139B|nr:Flp pilus assembly protein CpaB [Rhodoferax sp.]
MVTTSKVISKMSSPLVLLLLAALLAGGVAWLAYFYLQQREESIKSEIMASSQKKATPKVAVVVSKVDAAVGTVLNGQTFVSRSIDDDLVHPDVVLAADFPSLEGQKLARAVLRGRPVRLSDLQVPAVNDVAAVVPPGRRALTISIDNNNSIAQTLRPNHRVDIFLMSKAPKPELGMGELDDKALEQTSLFMQNVVVLATGKEFVDVNAPSERTAQMVRPGEVQGASQQDKNYDSITLLVTPAEAARLLVGQKMGSYGVVLRGKQDQEPLAMLSLRAGDLMPGVRRRAELESIEFIVGGRGDKLLSKLPTAARTPLANDHRIVAAPADVSAALASNAGHTAVRAGEPMLANQPIPALR